MIPNQGLQEELIGTEGEIESLQHESLLADDVFHALLSDAHPVGTLGKIHLRAMEHQRQERRKILVEPSGDGIQKAKLRASDASKEPIAHHLATTIPLKFLAMVDAHKLLALMLIEETMNRIL